MEKETPEAIALRMYDWHNFARGSTKADAIKKALRAVARAYPGNAEYREAQARATTALTKIAFFNGQGGSNGE